jgi:CheY-like chemotaxis protein
MSRSGKCGSSSPLELPRAAVVTELTNDAFASRHQLSRILVVDDHETVRAALLEYLRPLSCSVSTAPDAFEARGRCAASRLTFSLPMSRCRWSAALRRPVAHVSGRHSCPFSSSLTEATIPPPRCSMTVLPGPCSTSRFPPGRCSARSRISTNKCIPNHTLSTSANAPHSGGKKAEDSRVSAESSGSPLPVPLTRTVWVRRGRDQLPPCLCPSGLCFSPALTSSVASMWWMTPLLAARSAFTISAVSIVTLPSLTVTLTSPDIVLSSF